MNIKKLVKVKNKAKDVYQKGDAIAKVTGKTYATLEKSSPAKRIAELKQSTGIDINTIPKRNLIDNDFGVTQKDLPKISVDKPNVSTPEIKRLLNKSPRTILTFFDSSKELIVVAVWLATVLGAKLPKLNIKTPKFMNGVLESFIVQSVRKLGDRELAELALTFGAWMLKKRFFESVESLEQQLLIDIDFNEIDLAEDLGIDAANTIKLQSEFYLDKKSHFTLDNGLIFKRLDSDVNDLDNLDISLIYHKQNSIDVYDFVLSVQDTIVKHQKSLSDLDTQKLINHYIKFV